ncbi:porin family protein [Aureitalea marina]|uniref:Outer membrane protein beta-barrel domain-containing protein n=1 Tax=Aureitalea marina TaxID=930804 RepID=A0A2S7KRI4_9FLAO|nr:porin family protein [Aureitalea marina]PQB05198.1 hypothetical protein BST85_10115 [Aureitalea marina]
MINLFRISLLFVLFSLVVIFPAFSQTEQQTQPTDSLPIDDRYREDQFYVGISYNVPLNVPNGVSIRGVSGGVFAGFLRDMPVNAQRNIAIAVGAGISFDQYGQNLFIQKRNNNSTLFEVLDDDRDFNSNRLAVYTIELPIEFRWRTSTSAYNKFWRIYGGVRFGYSYYHKSKLKESGNTITTTEIPEFEKFRMGVTLSMGYSTFNFYGYYGLNPFFPDGRTEDGQEVNFQALKLGLIFYIL